MLIEQVEKQTCKSAGTDDLFEETALSSVPVNILTRGVLRHMVV